MGIITVYIYNFLKIGEGDSGNRDTSSTVDRR